VEETARFCQQKHAQADLLVVANKQVGHARTQGSIFAGMQAAPVALLD
jgi:hypothetical protein